MTMDMSDKDKEILENSGLLNDESLSPGAAEFYAKQKAALETQRQAAEKANYGALAEKKPSDSSVDTRTADQRAKDQYRKGVI